LARALQLITAPNGESFNTEGNDMKPIARRNDLVVKRDTGELFIEDILNHNLIRLNPTSAYVWEKCDGSRDTTEIAAEMGHELGVSVSENVVLLAVRRLQGERLLEFA
jgi:hypothetical protein